MENLVLTFKLLQDVLNYENVKFRVGDLINKLFSEVKKKLHDAKEQYLFGIKLKTLT